MKKIRFRRFMIQCWFSCDASAIGKLKAAIGIKVLMSAPNNYPNHPNLKIMRAEDMHQMINRRDPSAALSGYSAGKLWPMRWSY